MSKVLKSQIGPDHAGVCVVLVLERREDVTAIPCDQLIEVVRETEKDVRPFLCIPVHSPCSLGRDEGGRARPVEYIKRRRRIKYSGILGVFRLVIQEPK